MEQDRGYYFTANFKNIIFIKKKEKFDDNFFWALQKMLSISWCFFWKKNRKLFYLKSSWVQNQYSQVGWNL